eukprot:s2427_g15.t1
MLAITAVSNHTARIAKAVRTSDPTRRCVRIATPAWVFPAIQLNFCVIPPFHTAPFLAEPGSCRQWEAVRGTCFHGADRHMWNQAAEAAAAAAAATWGDGWDDPMDPIGDGADGAWDPYAKPLNGHGHGSGASGSNGSGVTNGNGMSHGYGRYEAMYEEPGFNTFLPYYQENVSNLANATYMQHAGQPGLSEYGGLSGISGQLPPSAEPQVKWWVHKFDERAQSTGAYKLRSVGSMRPTNLGPTQPKGCRNKAREQRVKFQDQRLIPDVPRPLRPPCDIGLAMALAELEKSSGAGVGEVRQVAREGFEAVGEMRQGLGEVRQVVRESFDKAYSAVIVAARAHEELCKKTEQLKNNPDAVEKLKRAKICTRDVLLWRWFGLTAWIYNQAEWLDQPMSDTEQLAVFSRVQANLQELAKTVDVSPALPNSLRWIQLV